MPRPRRARSRCLRLPCAPLLGLSLALLACVDKSDVTHASCATPGACGSTGDASSEGGDSSDATTATATTATATTSSTSASSTTDASSSDTTAAEGSSSGGAESSSTGEPADNLFAPCHEDADCTSGVCYDHFCTVVCSPEDAEPCPPPPAGSRGITISCGIIGTPGGLDHFCEGCIDCPSYCIATCETFDATCPNGGACIPDACAPGLNHCGVSAGEGGDLGCADEFDNDEDGYVDCDDFDCTSNPEVTVCGPGENTDATCGNGDDDDGDGFVDCDDLDCVISPGVTVC